MTRNLFIFLGTFVGGALLALVVRAAMFEPHAGHEGHPAPGGDYAPMVSNALTPANAVGTTSPAVPPANPSAKPAPADHDSHGAAPTGTTSAANTKPVNTVCAICGMEVDPAIPTAEYQGRTIGFGCRMCPPKFKAEPDRWGPLYLKNEVAKRN